MGRSAGSEVFSLVSWRTPGHIPIQWRWVLNWAMVSHALPAKWSKEAGRSLKCRTAGVPVNGQTSCLNFPAARPGHYDPFSVQPHATDGLLMFVQGLGQLEGRRFFGGTTF